MAAKATPVPHGAALFGHPDRSAILAQIAKHGPMSARGIARDLGLEVAQTSRIIAQYVEMGILRRLGRLNRSTVEFNESFFAFPDLIGLVQAIAGQRVIVIRDSQQAPIVTTRLTLLKLFGTENRTRVLLALAVFGRANLNAISTIAHVETRSASHVVDYFDDLNVAKSDRVDNQRLIQLNDQYRFHPLLEPLLLRLSQGFPGIVSTADFINAQIETKDAERNLGPAKAWTHDLMPIGDSAQATVLYELGHRGPMTMLGLSKAGGISMDAARSAVLSLERFGLVLQSCYDTGYRRKRWATLNPMHPLTQPIEQYTRDIASVYPAVPAYRVPPPGFPDAVVKPKIIHRLPGMKLRTGVLVAVFNEPGIDVPRLRRLLREPNHRRIKRWLQRLQQAGLIDYGTHDGELVAFPNPRFAAAKALTDLILAMSEFFQGANEKHADKRPLEKSDSPMR